MSYVRIKFIHTLLDEAYAESMKLVKDKPTQEIQDVLEAIDNVQHKLDVYSDNLKTKTNE